MDKKSTICLWIDGIGLSSSWAGNAFMSTNPKNFLDAWAQYRRTTVSPCFNLQSEVENKEIDFTRVNGGEDYPSDKVFLDQYIQKGKLNQNEELKKIIEETVKRNAAVHLIGNLPNEREAYSSFSHLKPLLEFLHHNKRIQVYIHLILGDDLASDSRSILDYLMHYNELIKDYPSIETASVSGQSYFSSNNSIRKVIEAVLFGRGAPSLTLEQAFSNQKDKLVYDKTPRSIIYRDKFTFKIKNFDTVLFFNHNANYLSSFMQLMTTELIGSLSMPKFLQIATFFSPLYQKNEKVISLIERKFFDQLLSTLNGQYNLSIITDKAGANNFSYSKLAEDYRIIDFDNYELVVENLATLLRGENKLVLLYINLLSKISSPNNFNEAENVIKDFDKFFGKVMEFVEKENLRLILFSSKAGLERLTNRNNTERMSGKTISPLPFIVVDRESKKSVFSKALFYDMIKDRQSLVDIAPTLFELLDIKNEQSFKGRSFNKEIK